jgi:hypothetical protein
MAKDEEYFAVVKLVAANGENRILLPISLASLDSFTSNEFVGYDKTYLKVEGDWTDYARSLNFEGKLKRLNSLSQPACNLFKIQRFGKRG